MIFIPVDNLLFFFFKKEEEERRGGFVEDTR
jgi:hypothetical protein